MTGWTVRIARLFCAVLGHEYEAHADGWSECARCTQADPRAEEAIVRSRPGARERKAERRDRAA